MNISFFARPYFLGKDPDVPSACYLYRGTSLIRGEQIAGYLNGKYNPAGGFENDICIYVKPWNLEKVKDNSYVDFSDAGEYLINLLKNRPKVKVIASSKPIYEFLQKELKNQIFLIPEHHCNFERIKRTRKEVTACGFIGTPRSFTYPIDKMAKCLEKIGFKFIVNFNWSNRQDIIDFYKQIDIQIVWYGDNSIYKHPTKYINASSFGIPTVANPLIGCSEWKDNYIAAKSIDSMISVVEKLKNKDYYDGWSKKIIKAAEKYHISKIARKYKALP